ncbi:MAG: Tn3 family transposase [Alphaproteobacteria bacterium]|nr:Tn3 family transposase [Alphaproteobacteria bacterium]
MNKASCLSLFSNAVLLWNTHHIQRITEQLREQGMVVKDDNIAKISPIMFKHIQIHGTYHFERIEET